MVFFVHATFGSVIHLHWNLIAQSKQCQFFNLKYCSVNLILWHFCENHVNEIEEKKVAFELIPKVIIFCVKSVWISWFNYFWNDKYCYLSEILMTHEFWGILLSVRLIYNVICHQWSDVNGSNPAENGTWLCSPCLRVWSMYSKI